MTESALAPDDSISHYRIVSQLGAGGMGEVYLAEDTRLKRKVALKVLPADLTQDRDRLHRFEQEASAASALNHPNIVTIYEIGESDGRYFIATEFIDGATLRQELTSGHIDLSKALDTAIQVATALDSAHTAGIIHRDIKPDNIMLRRDGYVKLVDFGLAKLTEKIGEEQALSPEAATRVIVKTDAGVVMGTANYMSPEQARGLRVDARTDIWSLGVVMYEMAAGRVPFEGATATDVIVAVTQTDPRPIARYAQGVPSELEWIIAKTLRKGCDERYQTARELLTDLRKLKQRLEFEAELERSITPSGSRPSAVTASPAGLGAATDHAAAPTVQAGRATSVSSAEYIARQIASHKRSALVVLGALAIGLAIGAYFLFLPRAAKAIDSIAVLPLVNLGGDPSTEYVAEGIAESLINSLTQLQQLRVVARSTAFRYKGKDADPQQVGRDLKVSAVLSGRVRQMGDMLNIQVDLADVMTGAQLWGAEYNRKSSDVLAIKQDIAREVTDKLRLRLSGEERTQLARRETANAEAYQFYLKGRYYWNKRTADNIKKAIEQFQQAADKDPNYALAYVGLADCHLVLEDYTGASARDNAPKAIAFAQRALQLDGSLAEAHASLAVDLSSGRDRRPLRSLGYVYAISGKRAEALAILKELQGKYERREAIGMDVAAVYAGLGEKDQAFAWLEKEFQARSGQLARTRSDLAFESLHSDPRYADLLRRMGL